MFAPVQLEATVGDRWLQKLNVRFGLYEQLLFAAGTSSFLGFRVKLLSLIGAAGHEFGLRIAIMALTEYAAWDSLSHIDICLYLYAFRPQPYEHEPIHPSAGTGPPDQSLTKLPTSNT